MPINGSKRDLIFAALSLVGVLTVFLPFLHSVFTGYVSPFRLVGDLIFSGLDAEDTWWIAGIVFPLFLPILVFASSLRIAVLRRFTRVEAAAAWIAAAWAAFAPVCLIASALIERSSPFDTWRPLLIVSVVPATVVACAATVVWAARRRSVSAPILAMIAMQLTYVAPALICLIALPLDAWRVGAYMTIATVLIYLTHVATMLWRAPGRRAMIATVQVSSTTGTTGGTT